MKDIPLRHVMYSSVKNILLTVIMTTVVSAAMQASSLEERGKIMAARGLLMMQEVPPIEEFESSLKKRRIKTFPPSLRDTSAGSVIAELDNPFIETKRVRAIFKKYLREAHHEILDLVLQKENGKLIKHHVVQALVDEFCGARRHPQHV